MKQKTSILTTREKQILQLLAYGNTLQQIAQLLFIEHTTVRKHNTNLQAKMGTANVPHSVSYAQFHGIIKVQHQIYVQPKENPKDKFTG